MAHGLLTRITMLLCRLAVVLASSLVVLAACSSDPAVAPTPADPSSLSAPLAGQGFQMRTPLFEVPAGQELQDCYFFRVGDLAKTGGLPDGEPVNMHRIQMVQKKGSHHMNLFRVAGTPTALVPATGPVHGVNGAGECFRSSNWSEWPLVANTQQDGAVDWTFPDGVANVFQPDEWLMLQTHYVNASSQAMPDAGEVAINMYVMPKADVKHEMGTLFATKQSIRICQDNPTPQFSGTCQFKNPTETVHVIGANGHFHSRGKTFEMFAWDGTSIAKPADSAKFYESKAWDDPPMRRSPDLALDIAPGGGVFYTCDYQWQPPPVSAGGCKTLDDKDKSTDKDCCYTFGPIVETNEHCNAFVYYWPKQATGDVFCN